MAPRPGASSSSTRASTRTPAGCTRRAASTMSTSSPRRSSRSGKRYCYRYGNELRPVGDAAGDDPLSHRGRQARQRAASPPIAPTTARSFAAEDGRWIAFAMMNRPVEALQQSFLRTKATRPRRRSSRSRELKANSSNNTIFADAKGEIAYLHPQFVPRRDDRFDYTQAGRRQRSRRPTGASLHALSELPQRDRPAQRLGPEHQQLALLGGRAVQPEAGDYPALHGHVRRELRAACTRRSCSTGSRGWTLERLQRAAFDRYQPGFAAAGARRWSRPGTRCPAGDPRQARAARSRSRRCAAWDYRWSARLGAAHAADVLGRGAAGSARRRRKRTTGTTDASATGSDATRRAEARRAGRSRRRG